MNARLDTRPWRQWSAFPLPLSPPRSRSRQRNVTSDGGEDEAHEARTRTGGGAIHSRRASRLSRRNLRHNPRARARHAVPRGGYWWAGGENNARARSPCLAARAAAETVYLSVAIFKLPARDRAPSPRLAPPPPSPASASLA